MDRRATEVPGVDQGASEDVEECRFGYGLLGYATNFGTFPENRSVQGRVLEPEDNLVFALRDDLLAEVIESVIPKKGAVSDDHG